VDEIPRRVSQFVLVNKQNEFVAGNFQRIFSSVV
jgi:hypothetical protein